ncbi:hypothetical protein [Streptomyces sp. SGAir0957]
MVVEVLDRPEEVNLLSELCDSLGWPARLPMQDETRIVPDAGWALRIVEGRIQAVRDGSVEQAVASFDAHARAVALSAHCRDAALVERVNRPLAEWQMRGRPASARQRVWQLAHFIAGSGEHDQDLGTVRLVRVPLDQEESGRRRQARARWTARAELSRHSIPNRRRDPDRHTLRQPQARTGWQLTATVGLVVGFALIVIAAFGKWEDLGFNSHGAAQSLVIVMAAYVTIGTVLAIRGTVTHRAVPWILPVLIPVSIPLTTWLGVQVQQRYLYSFGISAETTDGLGTVWAGLWVLWVACGTVLLAVSYVGWIRYLNSSADPRTTWMMWTPPLALGALFGVAMAGIVLFTAGRAGWAAREAEATGNVTGNYFGLQAGHVCLRFVSEDAPFFGVRPPEDRALVTFGPNGDRIDVWVPPVNGADRGRSASIRLEDAQITYVENAQSPCPKPAQFR